MISDTRASFQLLLRVGVTQELAGGWTVYQHAHVDMLCRKAIWQPDVGRRWILAMDRVCLGGGLEGCFREMMTSVASVVCPDTGHRVCPKLPLPTLSMGTNIAPEAQTQP